MSMTGLRVAVPAPARTAHRFGLFSVLDFLSERPLQLSWDSIGCGLLSTNEDPCLTGVNDLTVAAMAACSTNGAFNFTVTGYDESSLGRTPRTEDSTRANQHLLLGEQREVETRLTQKLFAIANNVSTTVAGSNVELKARVALGEAETAVNLLGGEGILFVRRALVSLIPNCFQTTGSVLRTVLGTPVAACAGWDASVPVGAVLGVAALVAARGPVSESSGYFLKTNSLSKIAQRDYGMGWECQPQYANTI